MGRRKDFEDGLDMAAVIRCYSEVTGTGKHLKAHCPSHDDHKPSLVIYAHSAYCFVCHTFFHPASYVMKVCNCSYDEAIKTLAQKFQGFTASTQGKTSCYTPPKSTAGERAIMARVRREQVAKNKAYLAQQLPYQGTEADALLMPTYLMMNVCIGDPLSTREYYFCRNRLLFPLYDEEEEVLGFTARKLPSDTSEGPKAINSHNDRCTFRKREFLYGLNWSQEAIQKRNEVFVVEGPGDWASLWAAGIHQVVALLGTGFSSEQAKKLRLLCSTVHLLYDADEAGRKAAVRTEAILKEHGMHVDIIQIPLEGKDPKDLFLEYGGTELKRFLTNTWQLDMVEMAQLLYVTYTCRYHSITEHLTVPEYIDGCLEDLQAHIAQPVFNPIPLEIFHQLATHQAIDQLRPSTQWLLFASLRTQAGKAWLCHQTKAEEQALLKELCIAYTDRCLTKTIDPYLEKLKTCLLEKSLSVEAKRLQKRVYTLLDQQLTLRDL